MGELEQPTTTSSGEISDWLTDARGIFGPGVAIAEDVSQVGWDYGQLGSAIQAATVLRERGVAADRNRSPPNLEIRTHNALPLEASLGEVDSFRHPACVGTQFVLVAREFKGALVEATGFRVEAHQWSQLHGRRRSSSRALPAQRPMRRRDSSVARSRTDCRRRCMSAGVDHLITLTKRGRFPTRDDALQAWARFIKGAARRIIGDFVQVVEPHKDGGFHLHVAVRGFKHVNSLRRLWYRALGGTGDESGGDTPGSINLRDRRARKVRQTASYVSKYITKGGADVPYGRKLYAVARGLAAARVRRFLLPVSMGQPQQFEAVALLERVYGGDFEASAYWNQAGMDGFSCWRESS